MFIVNKFKVIITLSLLAQFVSCASNDEISEKCLEVRAAFDIGSGATRMVVGQVNKCKNEIVKLLLEKSEKVSFKDDLTQSSTNRFSQKIAREGIKVLNDLKKSAEKFNVDKHVGLCTQAFREAKNGHKTLNYISKKTGIKLVVVNQEVEALTGALGAKTKLSKKSAAAPFTVWDIGGASMQISNINDIKKTPPYLGKLAAVSFKTLVMNRLIKDPSRKSPNPLGSDNALKAIKLAKEHAKLTVAKSFVPNKTVYGIGGVHYYSVRGQVLKKGKTYSKKELTEKVLQRSLLNDEEIGGKYAATDVTNLALVLGFMQALNIEKVQAMKVNMGHGMLINPNLW